MNQLFTKSLNRRQMMSNLSLLGVGVVLASCSPTMQTEPEPMPEPTPTPTPDMIDDLDILQLATTAEYLAVDAYTNILGAGFDQEAIDYFTVARQQEQAHLDALIATIQGPFKGTPVAKPEFVYGFEFTPANHIKILETMIALETAFTGAYLGAIPLIQNKDVLAAAGSIAMNEEAHLTILRDTLIGLGGTVSGKQVPNGRTFGIPITPEEATAAVSGFIKK